MSGLKNTVRRLTNVSRGRGYKTNKERRAEVTEDRENREAGAQAIKDEMFSNAQMPDSDDIRRRNRREQAGRRGSRADTVLTDRLGG